MHKTCKNSKEDFEKLNNNSYFSKLFREILSQTKEDLCVK